VVRTMQAVELAQHGGGRRPCLRLGQAGNQYLDARTENEGFLMMQRRPAASGQGAEENEQQA
jgi:hypothetical protein